MNFKQLILPLIIFTISLNSYGQIRYNGSPISLNNNIKTEAPVITMESFNIDKLITEDHVNEKSKKEAYRFAKEFKLDISTKKHGLWETTKNGTKVWRLSLSSKNAYSLYLILNNLNIPKGAKIFVYNKNKSTTLGAYTSENNKSSNILAIEPIEGDFLTIEYNEPANSDFNGSFKITNLFHDYKSIFSSKANKDGQFGESGICNVDINCPDGDDWQTEKRAISRIIMNGYLCSGSLINNTSNDGTPYFLTAHHCTGTNKPYDSWIFYFNYESPSCNGSDGSVSQTISGCDLKATTSNLDFCLVELGETPPSSYNPYYAGWSRSTSAAQNITGIHHPSGDVKKIAKSNNAPITGNYNSGEFGNNVHWLIEDWHVGVTEGGSSGSPIFDQNHRIVGDLTGGQASCDYPHNDYYAKFNVSWDTYSNQSEQLKYWLDPENTNPTTLDGYDPLNECSFDNNFSTDDKLTYYSFDDNTWGYWSGHNKNGFTKFAEKFTNTNQYLYGLKLAVAKAYSATNDSYITIKVWDGNTLPGSVISYATINISNLTEDHWNYLEFSQPLETTGDFYIGYEVNYSNPTDTFAIYQAHDRYGSNNNTAFIYDGSWKSSSSLGLTTSLGIEVRTCITNDINKFTPKLTPINQEIVKETKQSFNDITIYPNPAKDIITVDFGSENIDKANLQIFDIYGKVITSNIISSNTSIDISNISKGVYIIKISSEERSFNRKIVIE